MQNLSLAIMLIFGCLVVNCSGPKSTYSTKDIQTKVAVDSSILDIDGNRYSIVQVANQFWMKTNLKVSNYNDGSSIPLYSGGGFLNPSDKGMYTLYDNDSINEMRYGKLYNYYAVLEGSLCPAGWHVPSEEEWQEMIDSGGGALLNFLPGGAMNPRDLSPFYDIDATGYWWTSTSVGRNTAACFSFNLGDKSFKRSGANEGSFFSVRCVK